MQQSLGVVCEQKVDMLLTQASEAEEKKKPEEAQRLKTEAITFFEKANKAYEEVSKAPGKPQGIEEQMQAIQKKIADLKAETPG